MGVLGTIQGSDLVEEADGSVTFTAGAALDGDGANGQFGGLPCYAPRTYGGATLDVLANAGRPGNWYGVATDTNTSRGTPLVQGPDDPCPGAYVSTTSLGLRAPDGSRLANSSPFKYVDAATVPFIVVPPLVVWSVAGIVLGCRALVTDTRTGTSVEAVVADVGPADQLGELSVAAAQALGLPLGTRHPANGGGTRLPVLLYQIWPGQPANVLGTTYPLQES